MAKTDIGAVAKSIVGAKIAKKPKGSHRLYPVLFDPAGTFEEPDVSALREAGGDVNGVDARSLVGTGGTHSAGTLWVRLDGKGEVHRPK